MKTYTKNSKSIWFPNFALLEALYKHKLTHFHGIGHILRVWILSMLLAESRRDNIDINVLSASALFHDIGRETDFAEKKHGLKSSIWIEKYLPLISKDFTKEQISFIQSLASLHNTRNQKSSSTELKILKDADALDRHRLPSKKIKVEYLRLEESPNLIGISKDLYENWVKASKNERNIKDILIKALKLSNLERFIPDDILQTESINEKQIKKRFINYEIYIDKIKNQCNIIESSSLSYKTSEQNIKQLLDNLKSLNNFKDKDLLYSALKFHIYEYVWELLQDFRVCKSHSNKIELIKTKLFTYVWNNIEKVTSDEDKSIESIILLFTHHKKYKDLLLAVIEFSARYNRVDILNIYSILVTTKFQKYFIKIVSRLSSFNEIITFGNLLIFKNSSKQNKWIKLKIIEIIIDSLKNDNETNLKSASEDLITNIIDLLDKDPLNINYANRCLQNINKLVEILDKNNIDSNFPIIEDLIQKETTTNAGICKMGKIGINPKLNLFYIYYPTISDELLFEYYQNLEHLLLNHSKYYSIDNIFKGYLVPLYMNKEFKYEIPTSIVKKIISKESLDIFIDVKKIKNSDPTLSSTEVMYKRIENQSKKNLIILLKNKINNKLAFKEDDFRVISNFKSLDLLKKLLISKTNLLNLYNIPTSKSNFLDKVIKNRKADYFSRTQHRDPLQRFMLIRRPNYQNKHVYYGILENLSKLFKEKNIIESIPTPTEIFTRKYYGNIILIFKKDILNRTVFTKFDSIWENKSYTLVYEDAKYLYEELFSTPLTYLKSPNPIKMITTYIEANILDGVSFNDVEKILVPKKLSNLPSSIQTKRIVSRLYPHIKIEWI